MLQCLYRHPEKCYHEISETHENTAVFSLEFANSSKGHSLEVSTLSIKRRPKPLLNKQYEAPPIVGNMTYNISLNCIRLWDITMHPIKHRACSITMDIYNSARDLFSINKNNCFIQYDSLLLSNQ